MNFVLLGAAGYVAPRHIQAIANIGGQLVAVMDPHDSVGILDRYFPRCKYFSEFERFDRFCSMNSIDYVSIASPNYLHDAHCRFALRIGAQTICEKPLVLNVHNLEALKKEEEKFKSKINVILQMRLHPNVKRLPQPLKNITIDIKYITPRGSWYFNSWKGDILRSGGLATNIGIHLFDIATLVYGEHNTIAVHNYSTNQITGQIILERATINFHLSIRGDKANRTFSIDGYNYEFNKGFENLHTASYHRILNKQGFGIDDITPATKICEIIRNHK